MAKSNAAAVAVEGYAADVLRAALDLQAEGRSVVEVSPGTKRPTELGWQNRRYTADAVKRAWSASTTPSLGVALGEPSGWLIDVDLDALEARRAAHLLLPSTERWHGRDGSPRSHAWYVSPGASTKQLRALDGKMLVELRSTGAQTVVPPSIHLSGEPYVYHESGKPAVADALDLTRAVQRLAAVTLLAQHWPAHGSRHDAALALAGMLLRGGIDIDDAEHLVEAVAIAANDEECQDRMRAVRDTSAALTEGRTATGATTLTELLGGDARIIARAREWLGLRESAEVYEAPAERMPRVRALTLDELLALDVEPREMVIAPWLPAQGLAMLYAPRGAGKTYLALAIAYGVAAGADLLGWRVPRPRRVLYLDGEMPAVALRERLACLKRGMGDTGPGDHLRIVTPDIQGGPMPDLSTPTGRAAIDSVIGEAELIVVDSISTLAGAVEENEATAWMPLQRWALDQRRAGRSVLLIHHAGKTGQQRGTTRREDVLDTVLALRHPKGYHPQDGARVEIHVEKGRSLHGDDARTIEAKLLDDGRGGLIWTYQTHSGSLTARVAEMIREGASHRAIAGDLGVSPSTVARHRQRAVAQGLLSNEEGQG